MFVSKGQFLVFCCSISFGAFAGIFYSFLNTYTVFLKNKWLKFIVDVFIFCLISISYVAYSYLCNMPNLRFYMILGVFLGFLIYIKTFHYILAKYIKKLYNIISNKRIKTKCLKKQKKLKTHLK